jgi:hypothetical protein
MLRAEVGTLPRVDVGTLPRARTVTMMQVGTVTMLLVGTVTMLLVGTVTMLHIMTTLFVMGRCRGQRLGKNAVRPQEGPVGKANVVDGDWQWHMTRARSRMDPRR